MSVAPIYESVDLREPLFAYISKINGKQNSGRKTKQKYVNIIFNLEILPVSNYSLKLLEENPLILGFHNFIIH